MEMSKKQIVFYAIFLLMLAGGISMAFAPPPEGNSLWDRIWKVQQPVEVEGEISIDDADPINVEGTVNIGNPVTIVDGASVIVARARAKFKSRPRAMRSPGYE